MSFVLFLLAALDSLSAQTAEFYVAPTGDDSAGDGTLQRPWATVERAQDAVRRINRSMAGDIVVNLRGGTYVLERPIRFDARDSGCNGRRVVYRAYRNERPVLSGGVEIRGWTLHERGIYKAPTRGLTFRQFYVDGRPEVRARTPNLEQPAAWDTARYKVMIGYDLQGDDRRLLIEKRDLSDLSKHPRTEIVVAAQFTQRYQRLKGFDVRGDAVALKPEDRQVLWHEHCLGPRQTYHFENAYEYLDAGGEWFCDPDRREVFYKPRVGEDVSKIRAVAPRLEQVLVVDGAENVDFIGLEFSFTTWLYPDTEPYKGDQSGSYGHYYHSLVPAGVRVANARHIRFERCRFTNMSGSGLTLAFATFRTRVVGNVFQNIASNAVNVYERIARGKETPSDQEGCFQDVVADNYIHRFGLFYNGAGINPTYATQTVIERNEIAEGSGSGMDLGWGQRADHQDYTVRRNEVHHVMRRIEDGAGIYASSKQGKLRVIENFCHDIVRSRWAGASPVAGLYLDQGIAGSVWDRNVVRKCDTPVFINRWSGIREGDNAVTNTVESDPCIEANAGIGPAYRDIKIGTALSYPPSGYSFPAPDPWREGFVPVGDATVAADAPGVNSGSARYLSVQCGHRQRRAFLRFSISGLRGRGVRSVKLRLIESHYSSAGPADFGVREVKGPWTESGVNWGNQPATGAVLASFKGKPAEGEALELELPPALIRGDGTVDLALVANAPGPDLGWGSRESFIEPRLFVVPKDR